MISIIIMQLLFITVLTWVKNHCIPFLTAYDYWSIAIGYEAFECWHFHNHEPRNLRENVTSALASQQFSWNQHFHYDTSTFVSRLVGGSKPWLISGS